MAEEELPDEEEAPKKSKMPLILGIVALCLGAGGGFFAVSSGMLFPVESEEMAHEELPELEDLADVAFVALDPIVVNLKPGSANKHLVFKSQLEVPTLYQEDVEHLKPRIIDIMNGYLSALDTKDFSDHAIITRLRSQLLRRIQVVAGLDRVNDLLVMEFVLN